MYSYEKRNCLFLWSTRKAISYLVGLLHMSLAVCWSQSTIISSDIISVVMAGGGSVRDTEMNRSRFIKLQRNNTGGVRDGSEVAREEQGECSQELLGNNSLSIWPSFFETIMKLRRIQGMSSF